MDPQDAHRLDERIRAHGVRISRLERKIDGEDADGVEANEPGLIEVVNGHRQWVKYVTTGLGTLFAAVIAYLFSRGSKP